LNELLDNFNKVYPDITVISISHSPDDLQHSFIDAATRGLGPDVMIGSQLWIPELAEAQLIRPVDEAAINHESYVTAALNTLRFQGNLYGLPLSLETSALYYNKELTNSPPETLRELLDHAVEGKKAAINSNFDSAFWGIRAFGGRLLDEEGRVVLNQGGFANWLDWLIEAGNVPNIILSKDEEALSQLFTGGEVAYYVGRSSELPQLQESLGVEAVGVAPLPSGPNNTAGPLLTTEPIFFSMDSSDAQTERAMLLIEFLGNVEQQRRLAQQTGRVPVNPQARINRRISPAVAGFVEQSKTAEPLLLLPQIFEAIAQGDDILLQALEGLITSADAADALTWAVNDAYGLQTVTATPAELCHAVGDIEVWHAWPEAEAAALEQIGQRYMELCPRVFVNFTFVEPANLYRRYRLAVQEGQGPDLLLISNEYTTRLAAAGLVSNISDQIEPDFLQRYFPSVPEAMRFEGNLYGIPIVVDTMALYYNEALVDEPPVDLGDLLTSIGPEQQFALPFTPFRAAHWGLNAFGGRLFDVDGHLDMNSGGFGEWLNWLREAQDRPGLILTKYHAEAQKLFSEGAAAYFVGERKQLNALQEQLGVDLVRVTPLPAGPEGSSGPLLEVQGLMVNPVSVEATAAVEFAMYVADAESQVILMGAGNLAPAHVNVADSTALPAIAGFLDQAKTAVVLPNRHETDTILGLGDIIYESVLEDGADPAAVLEGFSTFFEQAHGEETVRECEWQGQLTLWHSVDTGEAAALEQIIADFGRRCPDVQVETLFMPAEELPVRLAEASERGTAPDLFLASHDLIEPLSAERLIQPITPWVTEATSIPFLSAAMDGMRHADQLYGLPHAVDTTVLYYNAELVNEPASQLFDLFASASISNTLALDTSFDGAFWGAVLFGGELFSPGEGEQEPVLDINRTSLVDWLRWLQARKDHVAIVMNNDPNQLVDMFAAGDAAYLISGSEALPKLRAQLDNQENGPTKVGVAPLPTGPAGQASPFLTVNGYLFSTAVSEEQTQMALEFAQFATSSAGQTHLIRTASRAPANALTLTLVEDSAINVIVDQARTSVLLPSREEHRLLQEGGEILFQSVMEEEKSPSEALAEFYDFLDEATQSMTSPFTAEMALDCTEEGSVLLWHSWPFAAQSAVSPDETAVGSPDEPSFGLARIISDFNALCPTMTINAEFVPADELQSLLTTATARGTVPDLLLTTHDQLQPLIRSQLIKPVTSLVEPSILDLHPEQAVAALRVEGDLFGLPQALEVATLYYNTELVAAPAGSLDELLAAVTPASPIGIDTSFNNAYWGVGAFGGSLFDAQGDILSDQSAFIAWLGWLADAQAREGVVLSSDTQELQERFANGELAYLVTGSAALAPLRESMGDGLRVTPLPDGPSGSPTPLLTVDAFLFSAASSAEQTNLALKFAQFAAAQPNQMLLAQELYLIPADRLAADAAGDEAIGIIAGQAAETAVLLPAGLSAAEMAAGRDAYQRVLELGWQPEEAVTSLAGFAGRD
ncbi:MAG: extracellular solute-binding protein, partial [Candidatus Promineifilaceae bacterium]|nr:extracellular solute-binding protein [Candidatus Promineifilaceae bacterium]